MIPRWYLRGNKGRNNDRMGVYPAHPNCLLAREPRRYNSPPLRSREFSRHIYIFQRFSKNITVIHRARRAANIPPRRKEGRKGGRGGSSSAWTKLLFYSGNFTHFLFARSHRCISLVAALWSSLRLGRPHPRPARLRTRVCVCTGCFAKDVTRCWWFVWNLFRIIGFFEKSVCNEIDNRVSKLVFFFSWIEIE